MIKKIYFNQININYFGYTTPSFVQSELDKSISYRRDTLEMHMGHEDENRLLMLIRNGDVEHLTAVIKEWGDNSNSTGGIIVGDLADDKLLQCRYLFVAGIALSIRAAIEGGLNEELAYDLSDAYINAMNKINSAEKILSLSITAAIDLTKRVKHTKISKSLPVKKCCDYISNHLHEKITLSDLSKCCGRTKSCLSSAFKQQLGVSPLTYVMHEKLEAVREQLLCSDTPIVSLATQYGFCTHSNLSLHFKKTYSVTPVEYRNRT
ncbi:AraC family transcriptional regulator [Paludicola sp. MB14-C6]|uniref:helix-turn-helix domain-containing protein n=1 Tax=Paludihabitans sp. MB14-C6 TaxID=3070656 RepID=UPI0027DCDAC3|nr:AraC family transcriptional regulator [Paludicola sp. MB14-C6]WMJ23519.1 AraC family transcriptional regulator [Paludicola sp. MB14-C6]